MMLALLFEKLGDKYWLLITSFQKILAFPINKILVIFLLVEPNLNQFVWINCDLFKLSNNITDWDDRQCFEEISRRIPKKASDNWTDVGSMFGPQLWAAPKHKLVFDREAETKAKAR